MPPQAGHNPDVLSCLASLSSDEVFTPPPLANRMLDLLPKEIWTRPDVRILDPCCKTGVFLREAAKRLLRGLKPEIPDLQERINHVLGKQLFGLPLTELTALLSRRTLYCSKTANGPYSIATCFRDGRGNIPDADWKHEWAGERCARCGAPRSVFGRLGRESHAYPFLHAESMEEAFRMSLDFDVIIGNPPYQMADGGAQASASPLYHRFVEQAKKLKPKHLVMIIPARWYAGGKGLDDFRHDMLSDPHVRELHDYPNTADCFPGVNIRGGVCIFRWDSSDSEARKPVKVVTHPGGGEPEVQERPSLKFGNLDVFIRHGTAVQILKKIGPLNGDDAVSAHVSSLKPFGLRTFFVSSSKFRDGPASMKHPVPCWGKGMRLGFVEMEDVPVHREWIGKWKVFIPRANNIGTELPDDNLNSFCGRDEICTESYVAVGAGLGLTEEEAENFAAYLRTKFARFCHSLAKASQDATAKTYRFVPMQDFSRPWTDEDLYAKYGLSESERAFIEEMIRPMNVKPDGGRPEAGKKAA